WGWGSAEEFPASIARSSEISFWLGSSPFRRPARWPWERAGYWPIYDGDLLNLAIILPTLNEEAALPLVLSDLKRVLPEVPALKRFEIIVADNGSTDRTAQVAEEGGAQVVTASRRGYGSACLRALSAINPHADTIV